MYCCKKNSFFWWKHFCSIFTFQAHRIMSLVRDRERHKVMWSINRLESSHGCECLGCAVRGESSRRHRQDDSDSLWWPQPWFITLDTNILFIQQAPCHTASRAVLTLDWFKELHHQPGPVAVISYLSLLIILTNMHATIFVIYRSLKHHASMKQLSADGWFW